ncbi:MAG: hypothetical protein A2455_06635 [Ignavibacteria bacterium RIFOXYC2_FULL_35_16]|nr:MAG: hypothetical protein A2058_00210 [Ignavibacteria bacterium GWA2_36_19]OGU51883.1 MAG: hypothetical protein A2006_01785 [Ignavibacteria bacterium GWC2_35_8]OGU57565.1 MAG: hypothetical protein A2X60_00505 [Ignavibacteria bacterium GWF2_35_20]OGU82162.1 MAG: hypothetical protein A2254_08185 [Ignavibacteria bacterium RIFOXYA2_FULL_35_9]OGU87667.1 MAG: hypothetical protein A2492_07760 [Ignavibacteria bacterium RIFOXYC12_FULL_35_11]OGU90953.1 MAG: hypothetical protein A3K31_08445 [Ignavibac
MCKKYIVLVLIPLLLIHLCGCYSLREISKDEMVGLKEGGDLIVYTKDSTIYSFKESNYHISNDSLYGKGYVKFNDNSGFKVAIENTIALKNIKAIERDELNPVTTTLLITGSVILVVGGVFFIAFAIGMSGH